MLIVHVFIQVKLDLVDAFLVATLDNCRASLQEAGVLRFDLLADRTDPTRYLLQEVYRDEAAAAAHKETVHYARWRDTVADMMAEPRTGVKHVNVFPDDAGW